jgi:hypothetical protein
MYRNKFAGKRGIVELAVIVALALMLFGVCLFYIAENSKRGNEYTLEQFENDMLQDENKIPVPTPTPTPTQPLSY